jgi:hypothetical protein
MDVWLMSFYNGADDARSWDAINLGCLEHLHEQ